MDEDAASTGAAAETAALASDAISEPNNACPSKAPAAAAAKPAERSLFRWHGELCASHPCEVIVATLAVAVCALAVERDEQRAPSLRGSPAAASAASSAASAASSRCGGWADACPGLEAEYHAADAVVMTLVRCLAILYGYYQFRRLLRIESKDVLAIAGTFTMFSTVAFTSSVIKFLGGDMYDLKDALFLFILLTDISKASLLARLVLSAKRSEVCESIGRGVQLLGPSCTLDAMVEALLVGVGMLSGVPRLVTLSWFACVSVIVNYVVFMTLYPACLSLISELSNLSPAIESTGVGLLRALHAAEEEQKPNPVVQRVKLIMSAGLFVVHLHSRWTFKNAADPRGEANSFMDIHSLNYNKTDDAFPPYIKWLTGSVEQLVILILLCALAAKFIFFEDREYLGSLASDISRDNKTPAEMGTIEQDSGMKHVQSLSNLQITTKKKPMFNLGDESSEDKETQTDESSSGSGETSLIPFERPSSVENEASKQPPRSETECLEIYKSQLGAQMLSDEEVILLVNRGHIPLYKLEGVLGDPLRGVKLRRIIISERGGFTKALESLPYLHYDYSKVLNTCCENVIGYVGVPVGFAGPLIVDGVSYMVPMATTEGALVASTNRGAKALLPHGVTSVVEDIGMTRAPVVRFPNVVRASTAKAWIKTKTNFEKIKVEFDSTSRFARLQEIHVVIDGSQLYIRFGATTGDAMGMNMVSKGSEIALRFIQRHFPDMEIISLSGNYCADKKPAAINWIKGRGKQVVCETIIRADTLRKIFKTDAKTLVTCNKLKNQSGSAVAGTIGGNNAHAANMVTAIFIATGQDPAQNVTSSNCSTNMDVVGESGEDLYMTCTMPSLEVGTVGGGTTLPGQSACLEMLGVRGAHMTSPGGNSMRLARIVCATVLAGELSLMAALVTNDLVRSHMRHNRSSVAIGVGNTPTHVAQPQRRISLALPNINVSPS